MNYTQPPLPYIGNKRYFYKPLIKLIKEALEKGSISKDILIVDAFGGSGFISHKIKQEYPFLNVIWNDFDNYQERLDRIKTTESLRQTLCQIITEKLGKRLQDHTKEKAIDAIKQCKYKDFDTLSSWLLFALNKAKNISEFQNTNLYNAIRRTPLRNEGYLDGVQRLSLNYKDIFARIKERDALIILDPPYAYSTPDGYSSNWNILDFLDLIEEIIKVDKKCVLFSHRRSCARELILRRNDNKLPQQIYASVKASPNKNSFYDDYMLINL